MFTDDYMNDMLLNPDLYGLEDDDYEEDDYDNNDDFDEDDEDED